ncbi:MAG: MFS transporter [Alphaproteobacteria bacterium]|nr:MFS transporter [Alphaproteobacteria bacterium]
MMATFMTAVESTIVATAMPTIVADLGNFHLFSWVFAAYLLAQAVTVPIYGRLADLYGRRRVFFAGACIFLLGSTLCGFAQSMPALVGFRALQGIGGGAIQPVTYTIVGDVYTPAERARVQGFLSGVFGFSAIVGPSLGAFLVQHADWSIIFWINLPVGTLAIAMLATFYREPAHPKPPRINYLAPLLLMLGGSALMAALIQGGTLSRPVLVGCVAIGVAALAGLVFRERHAEAPMLPFRLWRNRVVALTNGGCFAMGMVMLSVTAFVPLYVQGVMGRSATATGAVLGTMSVSWALSGAIAGRILVHTGYRTTAMIGGAALAIGSIVLVAVTPARGPLWVGAGTMLVGIGMGFCNTTFLVSVQAAVERTQRGTGTASNIFSRLVGQSVGAALFGGLVNLGVMLIVPEARDAAENLMDPALRRGLPADELVALTQAMAAALQNVHLVAAVAGVAALVVGSRLPRTLDATAPPSRRRE